MWEHKSTGFHSNGLRLFLESPGRWLLSYIRLDEVNEGHKQGMIPFNSLLNVVKESKDLIYAATAFMKSSLFLPQLWIYGTINPSCEFKEVLCLTSFHNNIAEVPHLWILNNYKEDAPVFRNNFMVSDLSKDIRKNHLSLVIGHLH